jgi:hypothetical protein
MSRADDTLSRGKRVETHRYFYLSLRERVGEKRL